MLFKEFFTKVEDGLYPRPYSLTLLKTMLLMSHIYVDILAEELYILIQSNFISGAGTPLFSTFLGKESPSFVFHHPLSSCQIWCQDHLIV